VKTRHPPEGRGRHMMMITLRVVERMNQQQSRPYEEK